ncbi:MAG: nucleotidyl transferase AbiEii/AbiGii toxin family protein [Candidatus Aminicenantes bacterium]|nr:nucleotidyl transferase AbiEii/AbiGii toxin family protein [Candidatus Aminicenantes bacterium]
MLDIKQIETFYPDSLKPFKKNILREYLQYKILEAVFDSPFGKHLSFMGGTAIHIIHGSHRFSEDLDFDNQGMRQDDFIRLVSQITKRISRQGYDIESRVVINEVFRAYLKFPEIFYKNKINRHKQEKLSIQIDTEPQNFHYSKDQFILNKFDVFQRINAVPADMLLSQKILCVFNRPRIIGRDFYDIIFLLRKTRPNFSHLKEKINIGNSDVLKKKLLDKCSDVDFNQLVKEVSPYLFDPDAAQKISLFPEYINKIDFK